MRALPWKRAAFFSTVVLLLCAYQYNHLEKKVRNIRIRQKKTRYLLQWGDPEIAPYYFMGKGSAAFIKNGCEHTNCFVTSDRRYFRDITEFDTVVFNGRTLLDQLRNDDLPMNRSAQQKYVYTNMESSQNYPISEPIFNNFFNLTWTYKLNSDSKFGYFTIYDLSNTEVGPKVDMEWPEMDPVDDATKASLAWKNRAAAWFVSNCHTRSKREEFARSVAAELNKFNHSLHIYGKCGNLVCDRSKSKDCDKLLAKEYYFYFAFENSFAEDYATEKLVTALNNYAIPVVYGGADYSRFLPPGSYLDGRALGAADLAETMATIIDSHRNKRNNPNFYYDYFRWRNHFTYKITYDTADICKLCKSLNDPALMTKETVYRNFTDWWNG